METIEKKASNFELNLIKIGVHTFQLHKGDRFTSNGSYFNYVPSTSENQAKLPFQYYRRGTSISAVKYQKDVLRADNIELVVDKPFYDKDDSRHADPKAPRIQEWEVKYAYTQELPKFEQLVVLVVEKFWLAKEGENPYKFEALELDVKRVTKENLFLDKSHPVTYHSQIPKNELNKVLHDHSKSYIMGYMENYNDMELALFKGVTERIESQIKSAEEKLKTEKESLEQFKKFQKGQGY
jgi:hypothetical protein